MSLRPRSPLFRARLVEERLAGFVFPIDLAARHAVLQRWVLALRADELDQSKEVLGDVFGRVLGHPPNMPGIVLVGAKQSLDHTLGRIQTPVQQAWDRANRSPGCRWLLVSNDKETRLYSTARTPEQFEVFPLEEMENLEAFKRFFFLLCRDHLLPSAPGGVSFLDELLTASAKEEAAITQRLYHHYRDLRKKLFQDLCRRHDDLPPAEVLRHAQTILDRILFIAFAEDRGLLPAKTLENTAELDHEPVWKNYCKIFRWIDEGHDAERFPAYNGGLFAPNADIDGLDVTDEMCAELEKFAAYDYRDDVSVDVLGHIFERSITDLEELRGSFSPHEAKLSRRKAEGVFYTPAFVTRYIVEQTLGRVFEDRWEAVVSAKKISDRSKEGSAAWTAVYEAYREELKTIRVLDLSCGSGAFLVAAFHALSREYERVDAALAALNEGQVPLFDLTKTVLDNNIFGVDLNAESVEITKLSLWLETAERGRKLTCLDGNIKWGNSIVTDPMLDPFAFDWNIDARWREGFDVVLGNPPYVRQERLKGIKEHLEKEYKTYHGMADLFVYFFERGLSVLKEGGRLGFIVTNKWLKSGYGEPLRRLLAKDTTVESIVDFGHAPIFPDADTFPCIVTLAKRAPAAEAAHEVFVTRVPRGELSSSEVPGYVARHRYPVPRARLDAAPWSLEPPTLDALRTKIHKNGAPLSSVLGDTPYCGLKIGFNEAFLIDDQTQRQILEKNPSSAALLRKYLRGQDIDRWSAQWNDRWLISIESSNDREWPWEGSSTEAAEARFASEHPAIHAHLKPHEEALRKRTDKGKFWWELRACAYYESFASPKILYQEIQFHPAYALDTSGLFVTNKVFFLPSSDRWLLAVLNSPLMWWYCWRYLPHMKDETLSPVGAKMVDLPIAAPPSRATRDQAEPMVDALIALKKADDDTRAAVLDALRMQYAVTEPGNKLYDFASLDADSFVREVLKRRPKAAGKLEISELTALREMYGDEGLPMQARRREALILERRLGGLVDDAYGLTPEDVALLWSTAPPRMPFDPA